MSEWEKWGPRAVATALEWYGDEPGPRERFDDEGRQMSG
jgi:hypothetical protein